MRKDLLDWARTFSPQFAGGADIGVHVCDPLSRCALLTYSYRSCEKIPERAKAFHPSADGQGRRGRNENKAVVVCESLRLGAFARDCLYFHSFYRHAADLVVVNTGRARWRGHGPGRRHKGQCLRHPRGSKGVQIRVMLVLTQSSKHARTKVRPPPRYLRPSGLTSPRNNPLGRA
jgi:hypothetical protein